ncbi:AT-hook motif nuclear-localized protein 28-like [Abrus precatorius]|uniref:AT-hook motif nuclear-localized protein n=1 Tax=Abrus precatorius TaxID=3816 RepID=A0A8B8JQ30_ABRPR|nr:AT-hook motif nuclear-localized protein 28-like [Abrus precatorius]
MFSKLHPQHHQQQHPFQFSRECEDDDSRSSGPTFVAAQKQVSPSSGDGATIEVVRRPRGRPPGSKNKPKPPLIITREPEPAMSPFIFEVPAGSDVVEALARFSHRKNTGLCVLTGSGTVANVTLRQPSATPGATVTFHGRFDILSLSATFLLHASPANPHGFSISLAGPQGQIVGGLVVGRLLAAGTVLVIAASFNNPSYHRLSSEEDARNNSVSAGGDAQSPAVSSGGAESGHVPAESCIYSSHLPSDVIWAPTARPPF